MIQILCLIARCRACGKIGAGSLIGQESSYSKQLGKIVQKSLLGFEVTVMAVSGSVPIEGCGYTDEERTEAIR